MKANEKPTERMVHVRLDIDLHRRLRVLVAAEGKSIQKFVSKLISREVAKRELRSQVKNRATAK